MSEEKYKFDRTSSDRTGVTMSASVEGNAIGDLMSEKEGVEVTKYPAMLRIDGGKVLEFDMNEIAEYLGEEEFTTYDFEIETSTHYGQMVRLDDKSDSVRQSRRRRRVPRLRAHRRARGRLGRRTNVTCLSRAWACRERVVVLLGAATFFGAF